MIRFLLRLLRKTPQKPLRVDSPSKGVYVPYQRSPYLRVTRPPSRWPKVADSRDATGSFKRIVSGQ